MTIIFILFFWAELMLFTSIKVGSSVIKNRVLKVAATLGVIWFALIVVFKLSVGSPMISASAGIAFTVFCLIGPSIILFVKSPQRTEIEKT